MRELLSIINSVYIIIKVFKYHVMAAKVSTAGTAVFNAMSTPADGSAAPANAFLGVLLVVGLYLLFALVAYALRSPRKNDNCRRKTYKRTLWTICIFNYGSSILHGIVTAILYNGDVSSAEACNLLENFAG